MSINFIDLKEDLTVEEDITKIENEEIDKEYIEYCYVLGPKLELVGTVTLRRLLISQPNEKISQIMKKGPISIYTIQDQEEIALLFKKIRF